ncbi:hypothetical protein P3T27_005313 [Kitasatospora sp. MAA19]|uniref:hypothetical protein n=1 Tax=Kitasatospora sp. MAA19 TaxID=3035090 RepID=UPI002476EEEC|nr:hypothetical protein [Kitasatospora sp. MAA19]MDH6708573.1 hypothetical protein [Kitasatospora sp. MAA19]
MPEPPSLPGASSQPLPPLSGLLCVDLKGFTELPGAVHASVSAYLEPVIDAALTAAGLDGIRTAKRFLANSGDGVAFGFDPALLGFVVHPFLDRLDEELGKHNADSGHIRLRMRAGIHSGHVTPESAPGEGNGPARNELHRLLDSREIKAVLARASSETTHLVAIISDRVYEDVVASQHTGLHPDRFQSVLATVPGKAFARRAWLYVPTPSGNLLATPGCVPSRRPSALRGLFTAFGRLSSKINPLLDRIDPHRSTGGTDSWL